MTTTYPDLFMRDNFGDTGIEPVVDSYVTASPDIIPNGQGTLSQQQLIDNYGPPLINVPMQLYQNNNIYVRATNNYNGATTGKIYLYYSVSNLLVNVSNWRNNLIPNNNGQLYANVSAQNLGQVAPGDQPFTFNPPEALGSHFCFVACVSTNMNPNPLPASDFTEWQGFVDWVRNNAWVAWHNVEVVNTLPAQGYFGPPIAFQNIDQGPDNTFYGFNCVYKNIPVGSIIRMYALLGTNFTGFDQTTTTTQANGSFGGGCDFPPQYETTLFVTCEFPGNPVTPPPDMTAEIQSLGYQTSMSSPENQKYRSFSYTPEQLGIDAAEHGLELDSGFVQICSYNILFNPSGETNLLRTTHRI